MATSSISGLASGLDTASIVNQLMQLEAMPQTRLKNQVSTEKTVLTTLQSLNTKVSALGTKAGDLAKPEAWTAVAATSSNDKVTVTAGGSAVPGSWQVSVVSVAKTHQIGSKASAGLADPIAGGAESYTIDRGGSQIGFTTDGTLQGLVDAINDPLHETGLTATAVKVSEGQYKLVVESKLTGAAEDFTLTPDNGELLLGGVEERQGTDAEISLGVGVSVRSATNTFTGVVPGLDITLAADTPAAATTTLTVAREPSTLADKVKEMVDAVNAVLTDIDAQTAYGGVGGKGGALQGDATMRSLRAALLDTAYPSDGTSMASLGIQVSRSGRLEFDPKVFTQAFSADPVGVAERFSTDGDGFAARVAAASDNASDPVDGTVTAAITGRKSGISRMEGSIEDWDRRLEVRRTSLERQYTALETALSRMNSQSNWLAGQLASFTS